MSPRAARAGREKTPETGWTGSDIFRRGGGELPARVDKTLFHVGKFEPEEGAAGGEDKVEAGRHEGLVAAVDFTEAALGAVAVDGIADRGAGGDHTHAGRGGRRFDGAHPPGQEEGPAVNAAALLTNGAEVIVAPQALPGAETHLRRP